MNSIAMFRAGIAVPAFLLGLASAAIAAPPYLWSGAGGLLPDQADPAFELVDSASAEQPVLAGGVLTLSGDLVAETMYYRVQGQYIDLPDTLQVDFRMREVSGNRTTGVVAPAAVAITMFGKVGNVLWIGADELFLWQGSVDHVGPRTTAYDTNDAFHDYRIVVDGKAAGSPITVWQDGVQVLAGTTFADDVANGALPRVAFGEFSIRAAGVSQWTSMSIGAPVPEPAGAALWAAGLAGLGLARRRRAACAA